MNRFFRRILLSVWFTLIAAVGLTFAFSRLLPASADGPSAYDGELVAAVARDLEALLGAGARDAGAQIADRYALDFEQVQIYVVELASGEDVLGRPLPGPVSALLDGNDPDGDRRLLLPEAHAPGHLVAGFSSRYPVTDLLLSRPGARLLLPLLLLTMSAAVSYFLARFIVLPVRHLREAGHRVAAGDLSVRVAHRVGDRQDDIALLARDFDMMTERIERLLHTQQRLMRDVSHELRSPLARLQALQSLARQRFKGEDETHVLDRMDSESERLNALIEEILAFARLDAQQEIKRQNTDIADLLNTIVDDALIEIGEARKDVRYAGPDRLTRNVDPALLHSAIENVVRNAVRFTADGTVVEVGLEERGKTVIIAVSDHGPGVPDEALDHLFEPFYQVDESRPTHGDGSGVGLAIAERAVRLHKGAIWAENRNSGGLRVVIDLPA